MQRQMLVLKATLSGPIRTETLEGREYHVVPAVLVRSKVLNNNLGRTYLPPEDITDAWASAWNDAPIVIDHPTKRGAPVSARDPDVLNARGVGRVYGARAEAGAIKGDAYLDASREVDGFDVILAALREGKSVENSTGFAVEIEETPGIATNGEEYDRVIHPVGSADHLAIFHDKLGACSVMEGCGLGVNHAGPCDVENALPAPPCADIAVKEPVWRRFLKSATARLFGARADNESDEDRHRALSSALREKYGADNRYVWVDAVFSDESQVVWEVEVEGEGDGAGLYRAGYEIDENGSVTLGEPERVRRVTTFEPVANQVGQFTTEEKVMNRDQMIAHLAKTGVAEDELKKLSDDGLRALCQVKPAANAADPDDTTWQAKALQYRRERDEALERSEHAMNREAQERVDLLDDLLYKGRDIQWTENELKAMGIVELRKVHGTVFAKNDYTARGGPRSGPTAQLSWYRPLTERLNEKEAN